MYVYSLFGGSVASYGVGLTIGSGDVDGDCEEGSEQTLLPKESVPVCV